MERRPDLEVELSRGYYSETTDYINGHPASGILSVQEGQESAVLVPESESVTLPTKGRQMVPIKPPLGVTTVDFKNALIAAYMQYTTDGEVTAEKINELTGIDRDRAAVIIATPEFQYACQTRGVALTKTKQFLTQEQDLALQILLDPSDGLTFQKKLRKAGISMTKFRAWMRQPLFKRYFESATEDLHRQNEIALLQLERLVGEGDLKAIQFKFEMNNRYNPRQQQAIDVLVIMNQVLETLARHVQDPQVLMAVAEEMKQIAEQNNVTKQIEG